MTNKERILAEIKANPGASYVRLWHALHLSRPTLAKYVRRLEDEGLVRREGSIGRVRARFFACEQATGKDVTPET